MIRKQSLIDFLDRNLKDNRALLQNELAQLEEEKANETKSSAGDKFETSREMMRQSQNQLADRLSLIEQQLRQLDQLRLSIDCKKIEAGALVHFNSSIFFFGLGFGKIEYENERIFVISLGSPFAKACIGKVEGEQFEFNQQSFSIDKIY